MTFGDLTTLADVKAWLQTGQAALPTTDRTRCLPVWYWRQANISRDLAQPPDRIGQYLEIRDGSGGHRLQFACVPVTAVLSLTINGHTCSCGDLDQRGRL